VPSGLSAGKRIAARGIAVVKEGVRGEEEEETTRVEHVRSTLS